MSTFTDNYNLTLPEAEDYYDVSVFNENFSAVDQIINKTETAVTVVDEKIGTADDETNGTVFGKLNSMANKSNSPIKTIQRVPITISSHNQTKTQEITPVDTTKSIVLLEQMTGLASRDYFSYTFDGNSLTINTYSSYEYNISLDFWIIEFN